MESRGGRDKLTKHLPRFYRPTEVMENGSRRRPEFVSEFLPDDLRIEYRSDGCLMRGCCAKTGNTKVAEVYAELPSPNARTILPINMVRRSL